MGNEIFLSNIFRRHKNAFDDEFSNDDWIRRQSELLHGLRESLEMIGDGEITVKSSYSDDGDRLMYKEVFNDDEIILVVHAAFERHPYGGGKLYGYEVGFYKNDPRTVQYGGGFGASGTIVITHTPLLGSLDNYCRNKNVISLYCNEIRQYAKDLHEGKIKHIVNNFK